MKSETRNPKPENLKPENLKRMLLRASNFGLRT